MPETINSLLVDTIESWTELTNSKQRRHYIRNRLVNQLNTAPKNAIQGINNQLQRIQLLTGLQMIKTLNTHVLNEANHLKNSTPMYDSKEVKQIILDALNQIVHNNPLTKQDLVTPLIKIRDLNIGVSLNQNGLSIKHTGYKEISIQNYILQLEALFDSTNLDLGNRPSQYDLPYLMEMYSIENIKIILKKRRNEKKQATRKPTSDILDRILYELWLVNEYQNTLINKVISQTYQSKIHWLTPNFNQALYENKLITKNQKELLDLNIITNNAKI